MRFSIKDFNVLESLRRLAELQNSVTTTCMLMKAYKVFFIQSSISKDYHFFTTEMQSTQR